MGLKWIFAGIVTLTIGFGLTSLAQQRVDSLRDTTLDEELLYLPNERLLSHFTVGMSGLVADLLWIRTIDYAVKEFHNVNRKFTWLEHLCQMTTRIDPHFEGAYVFGGMILAGVGEDDRALALIHQGMIANPRSWKIPFEAAKVFMLNRRSDPGSPEMAIYYLRIVAENSDQPEFYFDWIERLHRVHDLEAEAPLIWEDILRNSEDEFITELARQKLFVLRTAETITTLQRAQAAFENERGEPAASIQELVAAGFTRRPRTDEASGEFFIDARGHIRNSKIMEDDIERMLAHMNASTQEYYGVKGRYPVDLEEWAVWSEITDLPLHPDAERVWTYDPSTGKVE